MKSIVLPYGQRASKRQTVNYPIITSEICSSLPKTLDNAGIVLILPSRTGNPDFAKVPVPHNYFLVCQPNIIRTLQWLQRHNSLYRDIERGSVSDDEASSLSPVTDVELDE